MTIGGLKQLEANPIAPDTQQHLENYFLDIFQSLPEMGNGGKCTNGFGQAAAENCFEHGKNMPHQ